MQRLFCAPIARPAFDRGARIVTARSPRIHPQVISDHHCCVEVASSWQKWVRSRGHSSSHITKTFSNRRPREVPLSRNVPSWNPQNVPNPHIMPSTEFSPEEVVRIQMSAIQQNDAPWMNHGIQTMYEFAADVGEMERSRYFGYSKDLYHFDHFLGAFLNTFSDLVGCRAFSVAQSTDYDTELKRIEVTVENRQGDPCGPFAFLLCLKATGIKKGCWMTKVILRRPSSDE